MDSERITATDAARGFSELLSRVRYRGEAFELVRGGEVVARLVPAPARPASTLRALIEALERAGHPDERFADDLEAVQADQSPPAEDPWAS